MDAIWGIDGGRLENAWALVTVQRKVDSVVLDRVPRLQFIVVAFTGYDHVDLEECMRRGIAVANVPGYSTDSTAELAMTLILAQLRKVPQLAFAVREGRWSRDVGEDLAGKVVGIVGTGAIGCRCAE